MLRDLTGELCDSAYMRPVTILINLSLFDGDLSKLQNKFHGKDKTLSFEISYMVHFVYNSTNNLSYVPR